MCLWQMNPRKRQNPQKTADESDQKKPHLETVYSMKTLSKRLTKTQTKD